MSNNNTSDAAKYGSIQQINKKEEGQSERKPIFPVTPIQAVFDAKTGASLEAILAQFNAIYVQYQGTPEATRNIIPEVMRRAGLTITYMDMESNTITERANSAVQKDNDLWGLDVNWSRVDELSLSGDISVSANGTWIINGEDTGIKAVGPKGDAGLTPWLKTIDNKLHFSYDNVTWEPCSENIAAWFRFNATSSDSQAGTIGKIQISRDNKTWTDLSPEFRNFLRIQGYVATTSALPSGQAVGTIYGVGPTYAAEDTAQTNPIYRLHVWNGTSWIDNGQFTSIAAGVVQETGDSETEVMSQKAVTEKLSELGSLLGDTSSYKSSFIGNGEKQNLSIPILKGNIIYDFPNDIEAIVIYSESEQQFRLERKYLPFTAPYDVFYATSISNDAYMMVHGKVYNNEKAIQEQDVRIKKNNEEVSHIIGFHSSIPTIGSISELSIPIHKGAIIYDFTSSFEYVNLYASASGTATKVTREMLPYKVMENMTHANQYSSPATTLSIYVYGVTELMKVEINSLNDRGTLLENEVLNNLQNMVSVNGIWAVSEGPNIGRFATMSAQITKYCPIKRGDIIFVKTNGITTRIAFSQEIPSEGVAVYDGPKTYEGIEGFTAISHIDGYFALFHYNGSVGTPDVYVRQNLRKQVYDNYKFPNKEIPYSTYVRADETETIADVILTKKNSIFKLIKGETSPCIAFVDFGSNKFGFYTPNIETETVYQQEEFGTAFVQGHKYQVSLAKVKGYIAKLSVTDLNTGTKKELVIDSDSDNLGISYCWGADTYEVVSGSVQVTKLKLVSLQKIKPSLMIIGDSNVDHGGLGKNRQYGYSRLIKENHSGDVSIFSQGGASAFDFVKWLDNYILDICKPTYALISTYNTTDADRHILEIEYLVDALARHQITPILATIHPGGDNEANSRHQIINEWVKNSGYMYFDLAELLSLNNDGVTVNPNLLNPDLVHFTKPTNELIAARFESDFGYIFD